MKSNIILCLLIIIFYYPKQTVIANSDTKTIMLRSELPWPGILPDHPLYILKAIRDKGIEFIVRNREIRMEYDLFSSKKKFHEMLMLIDKQKFTEAYKAGMKSQHFLTLFVTDYKWTIYYKDSFYPSIENDFTKTIQMEQLLLDDAIVSRIPATEQFPFRQLRQYSDSNQQGFTAFKETIR